MLFAASACGVDESVVVSPESAADLPRTTLQRISIAVTESVETLPLPGCHTMWITTHDDEPPPGACEQTSSVHRFTARYEDETVTSVALDVRADPLFAMQLVSRSLAGRLLLVVVVPPPDAAVVRLIDSVGEVADQVSPSGDLVALAGLGSDLTVEAVSVDGTVIAECPPDGVTLEGITYACTLAPGVAVPVTTTAGVTTTTVGVDPAAGTSDITDDVAETVLLAESPDGRFTYSASYTGGSDSLLNGTLMVDDGSGAMPALRDPRDKFDEINDMVFGPDGLVAWATDDYTYGRLIFIGRIDDGGRVLDSHEVVDPNIQLWGTGTFDDAGVLTSPTRDNPPGYAHDTTTDPWFVMSAQPVPQIETDQPLVGVLESEGYWALDDPGFWYRGDTLGRDPGCGASTLYKDDADGYSRVLDAATELDLVVDVDATSSSHSGGAYTVGSMRAVIISTECPDEYEGRRVYWGIESIDYGDGGPRFESPLTVSLALDAPVAEVLSVTTVIRSGGGCCDQIAALELEIEQLDGTAALIEVPTGW